ncbi:hypothetical protein I310_00769 [Cryptococcus deuterogattii CA1014]|nr:hypothetical protein I310_00769 [Cryptococcus deuterogattii CA1014]
MSIKHVGLPFEIVNPVGGAIAFGHPLGCTGARQLATAFGEAKRENKKVFVTSVCIGTGMHGRSLRERTVALRRGELCWSVGNFRAENPGTGNTLCVRADTEIINFRLPLPPHTTTYPIPDSLIYTISPYETLTLNLTDSSPERWFALDMGNMKGSYKSWTLRASWPGSVRDTCSLCKKKRPY